MRMDITCDSHWMDSVQSRKGCINARYRGVEIIQRQNRQFKRRKWISTFLRKSRSSRSIRTSVLFEKERELWEYWKEWGEKGNNCGYSEKMQMIFGDGMLSMNEVNRGIGVVSGSWVGYRWIWWNRMRIWEWGTILRVFLKWEWWIGI